METVCSRISEGGEVDDFTGGAATIEKFHQVLERASDSTEVKIPYPVFITNHFLALTKMY